MAEQFAQLGENLIRFIEAQHMFFVATAAADGRVNLSPKGMDSLKVLSPTRVIWLNASGSGNESAAHVLQNPRMTLMLCSFEAKPMILRLYGQARAVHQLDEDWNTLYSHFTPLPGARQIFDVTLDLVQTSCGYAVPFYEFQGERDTLKTWAENKGQEGLTDHWLKNNQTSLDGLPTEIAARNIGPKD